MEVEQVFKLTSADFHSLQKIIERKINEKSTYKNKIFLLQVITWIPFGIGALYLLKFYNAEIELSSEITQITSAFVLWFILLFASGVFRRHAYIKSWLHPNGWFYREHSVNFSADGFEINSETGKSFFTWSAVIDAVADEKNYYLFIDASQALIFPRQVLDASPLAAEKIQAFLAPTIKPT